MVTAQVMPSPTEQAIFTAQLPRSQFAALLAAIQDSEHWLHRKLADFKADVQQAEDEAATKAVNRVRNDKPYHYKKKAHEEQARFNVQMEESVQEAHDAFTAHASFTCTQYSNLPYKWLWKNVRGFWPIGKSL